MFLIYIQIYVFNLLFIRANDKKGKFTYTDLIYINLAETEIDIVLKDCELNCVLIPGIIRPVDIINISFLSYEK